jgi:D-3-phosphoglycerate dehydrogenase
MNRLQVLIPTRAAPEMLQALAAHDELEIVAPGNLNVEQLHKALAHAHAVIIRSNNLLDAAALAQAPRLRVIGRAGSGVDNVDVQEATRRGVVVLNTPGANARATAEHTLAMLFAVSRHIPAAHDSLHAGTWEKARFLGTELRGKTMGLLGVGRVGRIVAQLARGIGMQVVAYDPYVPPHADDPFERMDLPVLLSMSHVVSVHVPLNEQTQHLLGRAELAQLPQGAVVLNCARGGIVDEEALCDAIESGHLAGAALDVFEEEPPFGRRVLRFPQIVTTPHLGGSTREAQGEVGRRIAQQVVAYLLRGELQHCVNPHAVSSPDGAPRGT